MASESTPPPVSEYYSCIYAYLHIYIYTHEYVYVYVYVYVFVYVYVYVYVYVHIHIYIYIYCMCIYIYISTHALSMSSRRGNDATNVVDYPLTASSVTTGTPEATDGQLARTAIPYKALFVL